MTDLTRPIVGIENRTPLEVFDIMCARLHGDRDRVHYAEGTADTNIARADAAEAKLQQIKVWCDAYPLAIFPVPDFAKAHELLQAGGMTLDAISASNMRHVLKGVREIIDRKEPTDEA